MNDVASTIVAVSTPPGKGGIAVIRMSGPGSLEILKKSWTGADPYKFLSHTSHLGWIKDCNGDDIDQVVATYYKGPRSYTGEDVVELSCHGSPWVQQAVTDILIQNGAVPASAGEFTRRAFINGRLDLAQADAVADMIAASSRAAARLAASQMKGDFSRKLEELRKQLVDIGVLLELELDFSEEDVEFADRTRLIVLAREIKNIVERLADSFKAGRAFKSGVPVALAGIPNAGKSSLLNTLAEEDRAIVSNIPGTTRDAIEVAVEIEGILFRIIDTAGLRDSCDEIEKIGVEKARMNIENAAVVLALIDPTEDISMQKSLIDDMESKTGGKILSVFTKADISTRQEGEGLRISVKTGEGIDTLKNILVKSATEEYNPDSELIVTNARHYEALCNALHPLQRLIDGLQNGLTADFLAQDLREAEKYLSEVTGTVTSEEILHSIFARYCIGK